jgi:hypothetical protein
MLLAQFPDPHSKPLLHGEQSGFSAPPPPPAEQIPPMHIML